MCSKHGHAHEQEVYDGHVARGRGASSRAGGRRDGDAPRSHALLGKAGLHRVGHRPEQPSASVPGGRRNPFPRSDQPSALGLQARRTASPGSHHRRRSARPARFGRLLDPLDRPRGAAADRRGDRGSDGPMSPLSRPGKRGGQPCRRGQAPARMADSFSEHPVSPSDTRLRRGGGRLPVAHPRGDKRWRPLGRAGRCPVLRGGTVEPWSLRP